MAKTKPAEMDEAVQPATRVLVVDNDKELARVMVESLDKVGYDCSMATSGPDGSRAINENTYDVVITDLSMNDVDGMEILSRAKENLADCEVIMVTGHATVPRAVEAMQNGAYSFLEKPISPDRLRAVTEKAAESARLKQKNLELNQRLDERFGYEGIIFASDKMKAVIDRVKRIAATDASVLITGANGTGKELIAKAIHQNSPRKNKSLVALNAGAIAENLVESELFGHVKGAFTDALKDRIGKFEYANGGTLFLDEIGDMPPATQIKLLRVLEDHQITRVGDNKPIKVNVRVLSATNRDLEKSIDEGEFRQDLYFRLKVVEVHIPKLADRREDVVPLADHFRRQFAKQHGKSVTNITPEATRKFFGHSWPGNVRELRNAVETMVVLDNDGVLDVDDLPFELADAPDATDVPTVEGPSSLIGQPMDDIEKWAIEKTLNMTNGNREKAAKILQIGARTLYRKLDKYGLE